LTSRKLATIFNHMVKYKRNNNEANLDSSLDKVFHALSDRTRRAILARLANGDVVVSELAEPFDMSLPAISKHLGVLEKAGLLQRHKDGRIRRCELNAGPLETASDWIGFYQRFWNSQLDSLAEFLEKNKNKDITQDKEPELHNKLNMNININTKKEK